MWSNVIDGKRELSDGCANFTRKGEFGIRQWTYVPRGPVLRMAAFRSLREDSE